MRCSGMFTADDLVLGDGRSIFIFCLVSTDAPRVPCLADLLPEDGNAAAGSSNAPGLCLCAASPILLEAAPRVSDF
jgi:hypothetical protein